MMRKNTVKRFISAFFALMLTLGICACQSAPQETTAASQTTETTEEAKAPTEAPEPFVYEKNATGKNGMVAAADPYAAKVGADILKAGGNAMDAAIATAYALGVAENCASGIGGSGVLLYYEAATKKTTAIDYWYTCPKNMVLGDFIGTDEHELNGMAGLYGVVPGFVAGMEKANEMFGTMPLSDLIAPAIDLAENGVPVSSFMAGNYTDYYDKMVL